MVYISWTEAFRTRFYYMCTYMFKRHHMMYSGLNGKKYQFRLDFMWRSGFTSTNNSY